MNKWLYPFLAPPIDNNNITEISSFQYFFEGLLPSNKYINGIEFQGSNSLNILSIVPGRIFTSVNVFTDEDINNTPELLTIRDESPPSVPNSDDILDLFLIPDPLAIIVLNRVMKIGNRGNIIGFRYSNLKFKHLKILDDGGWNGRTTIGKAKTDQKVVTLDETGKVARDDNGFPLFNDSEWRYFINGAYSIKLDTGIHIAEVEPNHKVKFSVLTSNGYIDPIEFYELLSNFYTDDASFSESEKGSLNSIKSVFPITEIPHLTNFGDLTLDPDRYEDIVIYSKTQHLISKLFNLYSQQYSNQNVYEDIGGNFPGDGQKNRFSARLHEIGEPNNDGIYENLEKYHNPFPYFSVDWQNIFQLESLCEFYLNFRYPLGNNPPLRPSDEDYREVNFNSDWIVGRLPNEVNEKLDDEITDNPNYIEENAYPAKEFPYIFVLIDDFEHIGGHLLFGNRYHPLEATDGRPNDRYQGMLFVIERFQSIDADGNTVGIPKVIFKYPFSSHSSQRRPTVEKRSSIAGNNLYITYSMPARNQRHNFCFMVGNSKHTALVDADALPDDIPPGRLPIRKWGYVKEGDPYTFTNTLPGVHNPLNHTINPELLGDDPDLRPRKDPNGKGSILFHRGWYFGRTDEDAPNNKTTGSEGCIVSPTPKFYEFRNRLIEDYLRKYFPEEEDVPEEEKNVVYRFMRLLKSKITQDENVNLYNNKPDFLAGPGEAWPSDEDRITLWCSHHDMAEDRPKIRSLFFLIRPNEPNIS